MGGISSSRATSFKASPRLVMPSGWTSCQWKSSTGVEVGCCQRALVEKVRARTISEAAGLSLATARISGRASLMAKLSAPIFPLTPMEYEVSSIQKKWTGRLAIAPPGISLTVRPLSLIGCPPDRPSARCALSARSAIRS